MKAHIAAFAIALGLPMAAMAQSTQSASSSPATVNLNAKTGNLVISFNEIDKNSDGMISVQEWNDYVRTVAARDGSASAGGATGKSADMRTSPQPGKSK